MAARPDRPNEADFANIAEEIESVGRSQLRAVESHIRLILEHLAKLASAPDMPAAAPWTGEIANWRTDLRKTISPSMPGKTDLDEIWGLAIEVAEAGLAAHGHALLSGLPEACPMGVQVLLEPRFDIPAAVARIHAAVAA